ALKSALDKIVVATDDERIAGEVSRFGGEFVMTAPTHQSGTDRCAEVVKSLPGFDIVINIQGDEPYIDPSQINLVRECFVDKSVQL
ncbi:3-deoxy-manno-octulosonate cytidylyltransferase, partial [Klebsiella pneumoniae]|nr:3-deoxy-manno-octulosonate cytidylyltransferase [Klebsiella pneumoniae]